MQKFLDLPASEQRRLLYTALLLGAFRLGLWLIPFRFLQTASQSNIRKQSCDEEKSMRRIALDIQRMERFIPEATCLTQALAAQVLLRRDGVQPLLKIGVAMGQQGELKAHAWIEHRGRIVVGNLPELKQYSSLQPVG